MKTPRLHLVCGLPGAGKTTRSKQIIASTHAVHLCADEWVVGLGKRHFLNAPIHELAARVRDRGGPDVQALSNVLLQDFGRFEQPSTDEILRFDRYFGPADEWTPA